MKPLRVVVAGGGAAGFFGAMACAESLAGGEVVLLEKSPELLAKVAISGGGRCNVTHACFDPERLADHYPRGGRELLGPFHRWQAKDTVDWFTSHGVKLKTESDGRMFPVTDKATTITDCLIREARRVGVTTHTRRGLASVQQRNARSGFLLKLMNGDTMECDRLLLATGGNKAGQGFDMAQSLGHTIEPLVPSLFTFNIKDERLTGLAGLSMPKARVAAPAQKLVQSGPILITHWGLSGPAILKLSAWGARDFADCNYAFELRVSWVHIPRAAVLEELAIYKKTHPVRMIMGAGLLGVPNRLWAALARHAGITEMMTWGHVSKALMTRLGDELVASRFDVCGKSLFKEEFVTCGGVRLSEVDFRNMESRICKGLYLAGEILDIDAETGGFNLQSAWTTGWIAGKSMGQS